MQLDKMLNEPRVVGSGCQDAVKLPEEFPEKSMVSCANFALNG